MRIKIAAALLGAALGGILVLQGCQKAAGPEGGEKSAAPAQAAKYYCPMHPAQTSDKPGDCPICNMRLVPVESGTTPEEMQKHHGGQAAIHLTPDREQKIGVRTQAAEEIRLEAAIRASARVAHDPELYSALVEYDEALKGYREAKKSHWPDVRERSQALVDSSLLRLRKMGIGDDQARKIIGGEKQRSLLLGEGDSIWVYADIYAHEASLVKPGQEIEFTAQAVPGEKFAGRVVAVDQILNPETRTLRVRAQVANKGRALKPEMYANAVIRVDLGKKLAVPQEAVMDTGTRQLVFAKTGEGHYEPREVRIGQEAEGYFEVLSGLKAGELVVASAAFLIDSESKLKAALAGAGHQH